MSSMSGSRNYRKVKALPNKSEFLSISTSDGTIYVRKDLPKEMRKYLIKHERQRIAEMKKKPYGEQHDIDRKTEVW